MDDSALLWGAPAAPAKETTPALKPSVPTPATSTTLVAPAVPADPDADADAADSSAAAVTDATFEGLGLGKWAVQTLAGLSITTPTSVQVQSIPKILSGRDVCGTACTGSGKTAAYALPILQQLHTDPYGVFAVVIAPTREITMQIADCFRVMGSSFSVNVLTLVGGVEQQPQQRALERRPPVVVATPGRLCDTMQVHNTMDCFRKLRFLVLDEADRLLDESFQETIDTILKMLRRVKSRYQLLLYSATLSVASLEQNSDLKRLGWHKRPYDVVDTGETEETLYTSAENLTECFMVVPDEVKLCSLVDMLEGERTDVRWKSCIIFVASCRECEVVRLTLQELGLPVVSINSLLEQRQRTDSLSMFKLGQAKILVATDVASRGLDIPKVDLVLNYDLPRLSKNYVHRAGRTARAGKSGQCVCIATRSDLSRVRKFERHVNKTFAELRCDRDTCADLMDVVVAARTRAKLSVNQRFGDRLREHEDNRVVRDLKREVKEEEATHVARGGRQRPASAPPAAKRAKTDAAPAQKPKPKAKANKAAPAGAKKKKKKN